MINDNTILAIIPARGGSKGIPEKNIKELANKPLIAWTIEEARKSKYIDRLILSSDDTKIINTARTWGCEIPFVRPAELAQDNTPGIEPVKHAIKTLPEKYDYICLLQPTSPLRKASDIDGCIEKCIENKSDTCVSVTRADQHPYWMYVIHEDDILKPLFADKHFFRRQDLPEIFILNGAVYCAKTRFILDSSSFISQDTVAYLMDSESSIDIDNEFEFKLAEYMLLLRNKI